MLGIQTARRASASETLLNRYIWALLVVTNGVDLLASRRAFALGIAEINPVVELMIASYGFWSLGVFKAFWLVILLSLLPYIRGWTQVLFTLTCMIYFILALSHIIYLSPLL